MQNQKIDSSISGVDEVKLPPQKTMIAEFKSNKQNYTDLKAMIEETKKKDNHDFGKQIVEIALEVRDRREQQKVKKDFLAEHTTTIKNWHGAQSQKFVERRLR